MKNREFWFLVGVLASVLIMVQFGANCGESTLYSPYRETSENDGFLCGEKREIRLVFREQSEPCTEMWPLVIEKDMPQEVALQGNPGSEYCLQVMRHSGYITISHEMGDVDREADLFTWCVTPQSTDPETMFIRSLTPRAEVKLFVP